MVNASGKNFESIRFLQEICTEPFDKKLKKSLILNLFLLMKNTPKQTLNLN